MKKEVGKLIKKYRESKNLTQAMLSKLSGVSEVSIRMYETGARIPKPAQIKAIANGLQVSPNLFLDMEISTKGEVADLLFRLDESIDMNLVEHDNGQIALEFSNSSINGFLSEWLEIKKTIEKLECNITSETNETDKEHISSVISQLKDTFYNQSVSSNFIVEKGTHGVKVKLKYD